MHIVVPALPVSELRQQRHCANETSQDIRARVQKARNIQQQRHGRINAELVNNDIRTSCRLDKADQRLLDNAMSRFGLSMRAYNKILKLARTIADLDAKESITTSHLSEALSYRQLDRSQTA